MSLCAPLGGPPRPGECRGPACVSHDDISWLTQQLIEVCPHHQIHKYHTDLIIHITCCPFTLGLFMGLHVHATDHFSILHTCHFCVMFCEAHATKGAVFWLHPDLNTSSTFGNIREHSATSSTFGNRACGLSCDLAHCLAYSLLCGLACRLAYGLACGVSCMDIGVLNLLSTCYGVKLWRKELRN